MKPGTLGAVLTAALLLQPFSSTPQAAAAPSAATGFIDVVDGPRTSPEVLTITAGDTVIFTNRELIPHNPTALDGSFKTPPLKSGDAASVTFSQPGTFDFMCTLHTSQSGTIVVLPAPAAPPAVADPPPPAADPTGPVADPAVPATDPAAPPADPTLPAADPATADAAPLSVAPGDMSIVPEGEPAE